MVLPKYNAGQVASNQIASWRSISIALVLPIILQQLVEGADVVYGALEIWSEDMPFWHCGVVVSIVFQWWLEMSGHVVTHYIWALGTIKVSSQKGEVSKSLLRIDIEFVEVEVSSVRKVIPTLAADCIGMVCWIAMQWRVL